MHEDDDKSKDNQRRVMTKLEERAKVKETKQGIHLTRICKPAHVCGSSLRHACVPMHVRANALTPPHAHTCAEERAKKRERILKGFEAVDGAEHEDRVVRREVRRESLGESRQE